MAAVELDELSRAVVEGPPDSNRPSALDYFKSAEDTKTVEVDLEDQAKTVRVDTMLTDK